MTTKKTARKRNGPCRTQSRQITEKRLELPEEFPHTIEAAIQFGLRGGVRNANVFAGAETFARNSRHVNLAQQPSGHVGRGLQSSPPEERRNIRVGIER